MKSNTPIKAKRRTKTPALLAYHRSRTEKSKREIIGRSFQTAKCGSAIALNFLDDEHIEVYFVATGYVATSSKGKIKIERPVIHDPLARTLYGVGYRGEGVYESAVGGRRSTSYRKWANMMARCYYRNLPTYRGAIVCPEWHDYQAFAKWFHDNYPTDGTPYELDKDIRVPGNKVYGPKFCKFVTRAENTIAANKTPRKSNRTPLAPEELAEKIRLACASSEWARTARLRRAPEFTL